MHSIVEPILAISNRVFPSHEELIDYCLEKGCRGIEYSFSPDAVTHSDLERETQDMERIGRQHLEMRFHCPFPFVEMASSVLEKARRSLAIFKDCVDIAGSYGGKTMTVHIGLNTKSPEELNYGLALSHLSELVEYGNEKKVQICLENLTTGWTHDPYAFRRILEKTSSHATLDLGHVNASPWVCEKNGSNVDFLRINASRVVNAHVYEIERIDNRDNKPYHVFPRNLRYIRPLLSELIGANCDWWLIELNLPEEVEHTRFLLRSFLDETIINSMGTRVEAYGS